MPAERGLERRVVTALFADLAGFTTLGDSLDPEDLRSVQDAYFAAARETIERYGGLLEKFIGDAVVALFGVPRSHDDDAERAVRAGLALVGAIQQLGAAVGLEPDALRLRVGINTGEVLTGEEGPERGAATGDTVNVAARLQAAAVPGTVLVGEETALAAEAAIELGEPQALELKGKSSVVRARRAITPRPEPSREQAMGSLRAPLLGRSVELDALRAATGRCLVVAPPGTGKTRLVEEFARRLDDSLVCRARLRAETRSPQSAVAQLVLSADARDEAFLRQRLLASGTSAARADVVAREVAEVAWPGRATAGDRDRDALFAAWTEGLDALAAGRSAVWIVEDVHWAGGDLLAFLDRAGDGDRLVLTTSRPSLLEREPAWCEGADVLHLPPLPTAETGELVRALVGDALPADLVAQVSERAGGNPLFVEELLRSWIGAGVLVQNGGWRLAVAQDVVPLPTTVQSIYAAQIDDLPEAARAVTRNGSVAGRRFAAAGLAALEVDDGTTGVDILVRRALVSGPLPDPLGDSFAFRHALLRDAAYAGLARRDRARLHVEYARWIEQTAGAHVGELAESIGGHYVAALENAPALAREVADGLDRHAAAVLAAGWLERAAEAALRSAAHETARELLRRGLELTPEAHVVDRVRRWRRLGEATAVAADMDEAERALRTAFELARTAFAEGVEGARDAYAEAAAGLGRVLYEQLRFHDQLHLAEEALAEVGEDDDLATGRLLLLRAVAFEGTGDAIQPRVADEERAVALARRSGDVALEFAARTRLVFDQVGLGEAGPDDCAELARTGLALGEWREGLRVLGAQANLLTERGRFQEARTVLDAAAEIARAQGLTEMLGWNGYYRVEAGLASGEWDAALGAGLATIELGEQNAYHRVVVRTWFGVVPIAGARGDLALLERAAAWCSARDLTAAAAVTVSPYAHVMSIGIDCVFARAGLVPSPEPDVDMCLAHIAQAGGMATWLAAVEELLALWVVRGERDVVLSALERREAARDGEPDSLLLGEGVDELTAARLERDGARARVALDRFREVRAPWWQAKALRELELLGDAQAGAEAASLERGLGIPRTD
jgi:class 3 adenylate cyclase/tetratricopeptide (TPR) repeat protein